VAAVLWINSTYDENSFFLASYSAINIACASRFISTQSNIFFSISYLLWAENSHCPVSHANVDTVKSPDTTEIYNMFKVPAQDKICSGYRGSCNMKGITNGCLYKDFGGDILIGKKSCLLVNVFSSTEPGGRFCQTSCTVSGEFESSL